MKWGIAEWWRLVRGWNEWFGAMADPQATQWPTEFRPRLEDDSYGDLVMEQWPLQAGLFGWIDRVFDWSFQLHRFLRVDHREPRHTHQATLGIRIILFGWYSEEVVTPLGRHLRTWRAGMVGMIPHWMDHRMVEIGPRGCVTLWLRGPTSHDVRMTYASGAEYIFPVNEEDSDDELPH